MGQQRKSKCMPSYRRNVNGSNPNILSNTVQRVSGSQKRIHVWIQATKKENIRVQYACNVSKNREAEEITKTGEEQEENEIGERRTKWGKQRAREEQSSREQSSRKEI